MYDWTHNLSRGKYELLIDAILRASTIAAVIEETADNVDPATLKQMAKTMRERILGCLVLGGFEEEDVGNIHKDVLASMYNRPDA